MAPYIHGSVYFAPNANTSNSTIYIGVNTASGSIGQGSGDRVYVESIDINWRHQNRGAGDPPKSLAVIWYLESGTPVEYPLPPIASNVDTFISVPVGAFVRKDDEFNNPLFAFYAYHNGITDGFDEFFLKDVNVLGSYAP